MNKAITVLDLNNKEACNFFLKQDSFITFDLPKYFDFSKFFKLFKKELRLNNFSDQELEKIIEKAKKEKDIFEPVNYKILNNKDGLYSWRLLQIIHPYLYFLLVKVITEKDNWKFIVNKFKNFQFNNIICESVPVVYKSKKRNKENQILEWVEKMEKNLIPYSLEFKYVFFVDILNCYSSIYTHSIAWALSKEAGINAIVDAKSAGHRKFSYGVGNKIDKFIQAMSWGQTNGIPEGSILMDFIAEMVLGYADSLLNDKIEDLNIDNNEYKIIRYRDDYRIFVNDPNIAEMILKDLTGVLALLNFKINVHKIKQSDDIITSVIKPDKLFNSVNNRNDEKLDKVIKYLLSHKLSKQILNIIDLEKELLYIYDFSKKFKNSGVVKKRLTVLGKNIDKIKIKKDKIDIFVSLLTEIALLNFNSCHIIISILSKLLDNIENEEKEKLINKIICKFNKIPNTEFLDIWLQRMSFKINREKEYGGKLCGAVLNKNITIWNNNWIDDSDIKFVMETTSIINKNELKNMKMIIDDEEVALFKDYGGYM